MTLSIDGVRLHTRRRNAAYTFLILAAEAVLSLFLYVSFAAHIVWPDLSRAAAGVSPYLSYEGRLADASGNPLGGTGEPYCFRFSIYDSASGGSKLWPVGGPNVTVATTTDGVFSALVGQADALTYNFYDSDTVYLNVDVNTATSTNGSTCSGSWETLSPRQQIAATGYAQAAENVYSSLLKTNTASNRVDVGAGTGSGSPTLLALDVNNTNEYVGQTCSTSGTLWYNSAISKAFICENGTIQALSNATTTIAALTDGTNTISNGTVSFADANGVSFGINGNTVTASVDAGGGGGYTLDDFANISWRGFITNATNMTAISQRPIFIPFVLPGSITWNQMDLEVSRQTSGSNLFTAQAALYSYVNSTRISMMGSMQNTYSGTATASQSGVRRLIITGMESQATTLNPGVYVLGLYFSASAGTASMNYSIRGGQTIGTPRGNIGPGANQYTTATSQLSSFAMMRFGGRYSATTAGLPSSVGISQLQQYSSFVPAYFHIQQT